MPSLPSLAGAVAGGDHDEARPRVPRRQWLQRAAVVAFGLLIALACAFGTVLMARQARSEVARADARPRPLGHPE